jgi:hypothetical protein
VYANGEKAGAVKAKLDETTAAAEAKLAEWEEKAAELERNVKGTIYINPAPKMQASFLNS